MQMKLESGFNRDIVECKAVEQMTKNLDSQRFNRDIVECKERNNRKNTAFSHRFNRDIVECKEIKEQLVEEKSNKI